MKQKILLSTILMIMMAIGVVQPAWAKDNISKELARVRASTAAYHDTATAKAAGYNLVPGLDYCFNNPSVGGMGYHLINTSLINTNVNMLKPAALVYSPDRSGKLQFVAVEYIVPISAWDVNHAQAPQLFGQSFEKNTALGVYTLHAWLWMANSLGMFNDWNPKVTCR